MPGLSVLCRGVALTLVLSFLQQLGACPCNCAEHNYWRMLLESAEERASEGFGPVSLDSSPEAGAGWAGAGGAGAGWAVAGWDHDCNGRPREAYVRQRSDSAGEIARTTPSGPMVVWRPLDQQPASRFGLLAHHATPVARLPHRAQLQVFLL